MFVKVTQEEKQIGETSKAREEVYASIGNEKGRKDWLYDSAVAEKGQESFSLACLLYIRH